MKDETRRGPGREAIERRASTKLCIGALAFMAFVAATGLFFAHPAAAKEDECLECHADTTPGIVKYWEESRHNSAEVGCTDCHGQDVQANHDRKVVVDAQRCGKCHEKAYGEHLNSRHALGLKTGQGCTRNLPQTPDIKATCSLCHKEGSTEPIAEVDCAMFLAQSPEMQRQGCGTCHKVESGCETCHTRHGTDLVQARSAETCGVCHMGPDHAQYEMWRMSRHGSIYLNGGEGLAPTCVTCHMKGGKHNVSRGIATGKPEDVRVTERGFMVDICAECHTPAFSKRNLDDADMIESQSRAIVAEAQEIVQELSDERLLQPSPAERPPHPLFGHQFVTGPFMVYEDISSPEAKFFRMMMFHYMSAYKGAFHQNPDYSHWFGNAPLKLSLAELRSQAAMLEKIDLIEKRLDNLATATGATEEGTVEDMKDALRTLKEKMLKGEISEEQYEEEKNSILDERGL